MQISNDAKLNMTDGVGLLRTLSSASPRVLLDMDVAKFNMAMPHLHHLACQSAWNNYWQRRMTS
jgi:hypothetical protein